MVGRRSIRGQGVTNLLLARAARLRRVGGRLLSSEIVRGHGAHEIVHFSLRLLFGDAVALLDPSDELVLLTADHLPIVVGQFAPFLAKLTAELLPYPFYLIPVHNSSFCKMLVGDCLRYFARPPLTILRFVTVM